MLAPRNVANCYVALSKRGGRSTAAARASTNQYAAVRVGVSLYVLIRAYVSWRHTSSVLFDLRTQSAGCECRGKLGNARDPQLGGARGERARSKSDTDGLSPLRPNPAGFEREARALGVSPKNAAGRIYTATSYTDHRALKIDGIGTPRVRNSIVMPAKERVKEPSDLVPRPIPTRQVRP